MAANNMGDAKDTERKEEDVLGKFAPEMLMKHPLQNTWTLWYYENDRSRDWLDNQRVISSFDTVEDFWSLYNHIKSASELKNGSDYSLFKQGVQPMWEDSANKNGGRWLINCDKKQRSSDLDSFWLEILLSMIGEGFDENSNQICGAVVNVRPKADKLALWTSDFNKEKNVKNIGKTLKEKLNISPKLTIEYQRHSDTAEKTKSSIKPLYKI